MKAKFLGQNGHDYELKQALNMGLVPGNMYEIEDLVIGGFSSQLYLVGYKNKHTGQFPPQLGENLYSFNTVMFEISKLSNNFL